MATVLAAGANDPAITCESAGQPVVIAKKYDLNGTALATDDILKFGKLPSGYVVVDALLYITGTMTSLALDVGVLNSAGDDTGAELYSAQASATAQVARPDTVVFPGTVNTSDADVWIAAKATAGTAVTAGTITLILTYRPTLGGV